MTVARTSARCQFFIPLVAISSIAIFASSVPSQEAISSAHELSVARGLQYLSTQQTADGSFGATQKPLLTGLALSSFLAKGHTPDVGRYGSVVRSAIDFLLNAAQPDGSFGPTDQPMQGQAAATFALAEACGVETSEPARRRIAEVLNRSVQLILRAQDVKKPADFAGGWRTTADAIDSDLPLTCWNLLALRAALDVGVNVPQASIPRAGQFVLRCYVGGENGFAYQPRQPANPHCTGAALLCLHLFEARLPNHRTEIQNGARYIAAHAVDEKASYFYVGSFYVTAAAYQEGDPTWPLVSRSVFTRLHKLQQPDGGWPATPDGPGRVYTTSLALMSLTLPYRLLPVFQR